MPATGWTPTRRTPAVTSTAGVRSFVRAGPDPGFVYPANRKSEFWL